MSAWRRWVRDTFGTHRYCGPPGKRRMPDGSHLNDYTCGCQISRALDKTHGGSA